MGTAGTEIHNTAGGRAVDIGSHITQEKLNQDIDYLPGHLPSHGIKGTGREFSSCALKF